MGVNIFMTTYPAQMCKRMLLISLFRGPSLTTFCVSGMLGTQPYTQGADSLVYISQFLYTWGHVFEIICYDFFEEGDSCFSYWFLYLNDTGT